MTSKINQHQMFLKDIEDLVKQKEEINQERGRHRFLKRMYPTQGSSRFPRWQLWSESREKFAQSGAWSLWEGSFQKMFPFIIYDGYFKNKPTNKLRIWYEQIIQDGEKTYYKLQEKNEKAGQDKKYNLICDRDMNIITVV